MRRLNIANKQDDKKNLNMPPNVTFTPRQMKLPNPNVERLLHRMWKSTLALDSGSLVSGTTRFFC